MAQKKIRTSASKHLPFASSSYAVFTPLVLRPRSWKSGRLVGGLGLTPTTPPQGGPNIAVPPVGSTTGGTRTVAADVFHHVPEPVAWDELLAATASLGGGYRGRYDRFKPAVLQAIFPDALAATLTPIGVLNIYKQYLFEADSFLGPSVEHVWLSPGSSLEITQTRVTRSLTERTFESIVESNITTEDTRSEMTELTDKISQQASTDSRFGVSVSASGSYGVVSGTATATSSFESTTADAHETMRRQSQQRSSKVTEEQRKSVKTTVKVATEQTDTTSRRYLLQNTTSELVNYELCLKMREVKIQAQFVGTRLCWINHVWAPSQALATSELLHVAPNSDFAALVGEPPAPFHPTERVEGVLRYDWLEGEEDDNEFAPTAQMEIDLDDKLPPGTRIAGPVHIFPAGDGENGKLNFAVQPGGRKILVTRIASDGGWGTWPLDVPYATDPKVIAEEERKLEDYNAAVASYKARLLEAQYRAFVEAARERVKLSSTVATRPTAALRQEERICVMRRMMEDLQSPATSSPVLTEILSQIFDFDEIFYFVAPDWWCPRATKIPGTEIVIAPPAAAQTLGADPNPADALTLHSWGAAWGRTPASPYFVTEDSMPAPMGASVGWILQLDGDEYRNAFLNSPLVKVLVPMRPGREAEALEWLKFVEGTDGAPTKEQIAALVESLGATYAAERERSTKVYEDGYSPLKSSFTAPRASDGVFSEWTEVVPTSQVVAVELVFDAGTDPTPP